MLINLECDQNNIGQSENSKDAYYKMLEKKHFSPHHIFQINISENGERIGGAQFQIKKSLIDDSLIRKFWCLEADLSGISINELWSRGQKTEKVLPMVFSLMNDLGQGSDLLYGILSISPRFAAQRDWPVESLAEPHIEFDASKKWIYKDCESAGDQQFLAYENLGAKVLGRPSVCPKSRRIKVLMAQRKDGVHL